MHAESGRTSTWGGGMPAAAPDVFGIEWNAENQLTRVLNGGVQVAAFQYDPIGRRVESSEGNATVGRIFTEQTILREISGPRVSDYVFGPWIDEGLSRTTSDGVIEYLHLDALLSVVATTGQTGAIGLRHSYSPYGLPNETLESGPAFGGREWTAAARLMYHRARYYDPAAGRFISEDPSSLGDDPNAYVYAGSDPVNWVDLTGAARQTPLPKDKGACSRRLFVEAMGTGNTEGWRVTHCKLACRLLKECHLLPTEIERLGVRNEQYQALECLVDRVLGRGGRTAACETAMAPGDPADNRRGSTCPNGVTCWDRCKTIRPRNKTPDMFGPMYDSE